MKTRRSRGRAGFPSVIRQRRFRSGDGDAAAGACRHCDRHATPKVIGSRCLLSPSNFVSRLGKSLLENKEDFHITFLGIALCHTSHCNICVQFSVSNCLNVLCVHCRSAGSAGKARQERQERRLGRARTIGETQLYFIILFRLLEVLQRSVPSNHSEVAS